VFCANSGNNSAIAASSAQPVLPSRSFMRALPSA
jgi:hypothetical protein